MKRILVTGATGTVGGHVASQLLAWKRASPDVTTAIRIGARRLDSLQHVAGEGIELGHLDYFDQESLKRCLDGVDTLFLLFPVAMDVFEMASHVASAAREAGVQYIVKISEWDIDYFAQFSRFYREEERIERLFTELGIPIARIHPTMYMDNAYKFWSAPTTIPAEDSFSLAFGDGLLTLIDTRDVAEAAVKLLTTPGHAGCSYKLTGVRATAHELADTMSRVLGRNIRYVPVPLDVAKAGYESTGMPDWMLELLVVVDRVNYESRYSTLYPDLEQLLGKKARSFEDFFRAHRHRFE